MEFILKITPEHLQVISEALGNLPFNRVAPTISHLQSQVDEQTAAQQNIPVAPDEKTAEAVKSFVEKKGGGK